jgi:hypothetical protein
MMYVFFKTEKFYLKKDKLNTESYTSEK